jgi:Cof subfamily protein (haloacid dehalogenase superfamily)
MSIKMIAADLDGTLLRKDKSVSGLTRAVIEGCRKKGILFAVATARAHRLADYFLRDLKPDAAVYHNGAVVTYGNQELRCSRIGRELAAQVITAILADEPSIALGAEINDYFYANFDASFILHGAPYASTDFQVLPESDVEKILVEATNTAALKRYERYLADDLYIQTVDKRFGMIMRKHATKINGVRLIADTLGIPLADVAAFGDDHSDIGMLTECGAGIAMANAIPQVKAAADEICPSNEDDGVARWLMGHIEAIDVWQPGGRYERSHHKADP